MSKYDEVFGTRSRQKLYDEVFGKYTPPETEPKESSGGFLDTAKKLFDFTPVGAVYNFITGSAPHFMGGAVAETTGNAAKRLGQEFLENSWWRRALDTVSDSAQKITDVALKNGRSRVDATDDGSLHDIIANGFMSNFLGSYGNLARMIHSDKSADAMIEASESMANKKRVSTDDLVEYFTNPYGFASDFANLGGSVAATAPFAALAPIGLITRGTAALGGNAITQALINRGMYNAAKIFAGGAPRAVQYGVGAGAAESAIEGGETRGNLLARGASED